jgi:hypothetical protein
MFGLLTTGGAAVNAALAGVVAPTPRAMTAASPKVDVLTFNSRLASAQVNGPSGVRFQLSRPNRVSLLMFLTILLIWSRCFPDEKLRPKVRLTVGAQTTATLRWPCVAFTGLEPAASCWFETVGLISVWTPVPTLNEPRWRLQEE